MPRAIPHPPGPTVLLLLLVLYESSIQGRTFPIFPIHEPSRTPLPSPLSLLLSMAEGGGGGGASPPPTAMTPRQARDLLGLSPIPAEPSRDDIRRRYVEMARRYHPDMVHRAGSAPDPARFRACSEARDVLLLLGRYRHGNGGGGGGDGPTAAGAAGRGTGTGTGQRTGRGAWPGQRTGRFGEGFPHRTLRLLTVGQNLALRGLVLASLTAGVLGEDLLRCRGRTGGGGGGTGGKGRHPTTAKVLT